MNLEERYYELREAVDRAWDVYCANPCYANEVKHSYAVDDYNTFCTEILEKLMEENSDVLARLK
jgi:hypothetical protein